MQSDSAPNPSRFEVFTQIPSGKGFKIKNGKYIYFFDKSGGWYDEFNNYYNADGEHQDPPADDDQDFQRVLLEDEFVQGGDDDYYDQLYGGGNVDDFEDEPVYNSEHTKTLEAIAKNLAHLKEYPLNTPVRVDFFNMNFKTSKPEILKHYRAKVGNALLNVVMLPKNAPFKGEGYFVTKDALVAEKLIKHEGEEFLARKVYFEVESFQDNLADPVNKQEMDTPLNQDDFEPLVKEKPAEIKEDTNNPKKKYFAKTQANNQPKKEQPKKQELKKEETKKEETKTVETKKTESPKKQVKTEVKTEVKAVELKVKQVVKEEKKVATWGKYEAQMTMFPKKESFREWMSTFGFTQSEHFKNLTKVESKQVGKRFATVELRSDALEKIQGQTYEQKKVSFEKVN